MLHVSQIAIMNATSRFEANGNPKEPSQIHRWEFDRRLRAGKKRKGFLVSLRLKLIQIFELVSFQKKRDATQT